MSETAVSPNNVKTIYRGKPTRERTMADLTPKKRAKMPSKDFALPGKRFPMNDKEHDRLAISGATRSENAGNISASTADEIKAEARAKLGKVNSLRKSGKISDRMHAKKTASWSDDGIEAAAR